MYIQARKHNDNTNNSKQHEDTPNFHSNQDHPKSWTCTKDELSPEMPKVRKHKAWDGGETSTEKHDHGGRPTPSNTGGKASTKQHNGGNTSAKTNNPPFANTSRHHDREAKHPPQPRPRQPRRRHGEWSNAGTTDEPPIRRPAIGGTVRITGVSDPRGGGGE